MKEVKYKGLKNTRFMLEIVVFVGIVCMIVTFAMTAGLLPAKEVAKAGGGIVQTLGMRKTLFLIFILGGAVTGGLFLLSRFPRLYKYPVEINGSNVEIQYHIAKLALCICQLITLVITCLMMIGVYEMTLIMKSDVFWWLVIFGGISYIAVTMIYLVVARHYK